MARAVRRRAAADLRPGGRYRDRAVGRRRGPAGDRPAGARGRPGPAAAGRDPDAGDRRARPGGAAARRRRGRRPGGGAVAGASGGAAAAGRPAGAGGDRRRRHLGPAVDRQRAAGDRRADPHARRADRAVDAGARQAPNRPESARRCTRRCRRPAGHSRRISCSGPGRSRGPCGRRPPPRWSAPGQITADDLRRGARAQNAAGLERLARRVEPAVGWDDIVLPDTSRSQLRDLAARARNRDQVLDRMADAQGRRPRARGHRTVRRRLRHRQDDVRRGDRRRTRVWICTRSTWRPLSTSTWGKPRRTSSGSSPRPAG